MRSLVIDILLQAVQLVLVLALAPGLTGLVRKMKARLLGRRGASIVQPYRDLAKLLRKGSKLRVQGRMTYPTWKDKQTGATRYGAEIVAQTLDYQGSNDEAEAPIAETAIEAPAPQPPEPVAPTEAPAKPKRRRSKKAETAMA